MANNLIDVLNSPLISGLSNAGQLLDVALDFTEMSSDEVLKRLLEALNEQDKKYSETILRYCERLILDNERIKTQNNEILENQKQILSLLQKGDV